MHRVTPTNHFVKRRFKAALGLAMVFLPPLALLSAGPPLRWRWSNPRPHGNNIIDTAHAGGLYAQVGERGQIYTSTDLDLWIPRESGTTNALRAVTFFGGRIVITGQNGAVLFADSIDDFRPGTQLHTPDWLEGVAAKGVEQAVAVGDNGAVYTSTNGVNWIKRPQPFANWLRGVAYGPVPDLFVAVGENGFVATSRDGVTWTAGFSGTTQHLNRVVWIKDRFWAVGDGGVVRSSLAGQVWASESSGAVKSLYTTTGNTSQNLVAGEWEARLREGDLWSNELDPAKPSPPLPWTYLSSVWDGRRFLLGGRSGVVWEGFRTNSTDPVLWARRQHSVRTWLWEVTRGPNFYLVAGDRGTVATSDDGVDWFPEQVPASVTNTVFLGVGHSSNLFVAAGNKGAIITSTNARDWTAVEPRPTTNDLQGVAALGGLLVVTGGEGTILTSTDGAQWTPRPAPTTEFLSGVESFPGGFVAVGRGGTILASPDGLNWTARQSGVTNWIYRVRHRGGQLVAVGQEGVILTSPDGMTWTQRNSPTTHWLNDVAFVGGRCFAVGLQGTVLSSTNAADWDVTGTITHKSLYGATAHEGRLVVVGVEGVILRSPVVPDLTPIGFLEYARTANENLFLLLGRTDQQFTLDFTGAFTNWAAGPKLEFLDSTGTLLFLQNREPNPAEFYRATLVP